MNEGDGSTRPTGLTKDAGWQIGVSRTLPCPADGLWDFLNSEPGRALWLGGGSGLPAEPERGTGYRTEDGTAGQVRGHRARPGGGLRLTRRPAGGRESTIQVTVTPAATPGRAVLRLHEERLASAAEREDRRRHWAAVADAVAAAIR